MSRLIDADKLLEELREYHPLSLSHGILSDIEYFPTAYDIDKVIEQLKKNIDDKVEFLRATPESNGYIQAINDAIEIVKKGGVE